MQPTRPTECHCPRRAATEARTLSVLRRLIRAVKVCKPGVDRSRAAVAATSYEGVELLPDFVSLRRRRPRSAGIVRFMIIGD
jgi:hypothetical protein